MREGYNEILLNMTTSFFVSAINNIDVQVDLNEGIVIVPNEANHDFPVIRLTNNRNLIKEFIKPQYIQLMGLIEYNYLMESNCLIAYAQGEFDEKSISAKQYLDLYLLAMKSYFFSLWLAKDNAVDFDTCFLYYENINGEVQVTSNVFSATNFTCVGTFETTSFSKDELVQITNFARKNLAFEKIESKIGNINRYNRISIASNFLQHARSCSDLGLKMVSYCSVFETLFSNDATELAHKLSERIARFLAEDKEQRIKIFKLVKKAYDVRSKVVHGTTFKSVKIDEINSVIREVDELCRKVINIALEKGEDSNVFLWENDKFENYFLELIMT